MKEIIKISHLFKSFGENLVLNDISFDIYEGEILCLLGPNGAGKTTTINTLTGVLPFDRGEISYKGKNIKDNINIFRQNLGIVPQNLALYENLSAQQNVNFFASLYGLRGELLQQRSKYALEFTGLQDKAKEIVKTFSGGMKRRLNIACSIAHHPQILIMDEPTVGIDPQSRNHILEDVKKLGESGTTIIYTTHYMEEVEEIATRIIIIDDGKIVAQGDKDELKDKIDTQKLITVGIEQAEDIDMKIFDEIEGLVSADIKDNQITIKALKKVENLDLIIKALTSKGIKINSIQSHTSNLESVFLQLTGKSLRD